VRSLFHPSPLSEGVWSSTIFKVPSNPSHSVILNAPSLHLEREMCWAVWGCGATIHRPLIQPHSSPIRTGAVSRSENTELTQNRNGSFTPENQKMP